MTAQARIEAPMAFTVAKLAARWDCSETAIRAMIDRKELASFRIGIALRIPASEVERIECPTPSNASGVDTPLSGEIADNDEGENSTPRIDRAQKPKRARYGKLATVHPGPWPGS